MGVDKISILGHSRGSIYGANLVLEYPDYYNLFIGVGQLVAIVENEKAFIAEAPKWGKNDEETQKRIEKIHPEEITRDSILLFNSNYSIMDWISFFLVNDLKICLHLQKN